MKGNSCNICAPPPLITPQGSQVHNGTQPKSVRCVMRRNPPASTRKMLLIEDEAKNIWFNTNRYIILQLAKALKCPPIDAMNYLYKLSFSNFGKALNLKNAAKKSCHVPLATADYEMYFGVFDRHGNLRNPLKSNCLKQLLLIMRSVFNKSPNADMSDRDASTGVFKAIGLNRLDQRDKNGCFGECVSKRQFQKNSNCKLKNFYHIDGRYAGLSPEILIGYPADAIGQTVMRPACEFSDKEDAQQAQAKIESCSDFKFGTTRKKEMYKRGVVNYENQKHHGEDNLEDEKQSKRVGFFEEKESIDSFDGSLRQFGSFSQFVTRDGSLKQFGSFNQLVTQNSSFEPIENIADENKLFDSDHDKSKPLSVRYELKEHRGEAKEKVDMRRLHLTNVLRNVNRRDRIAKNVNDIIDAVNNVDIDITNSRRNTQTDLINKISEHYSGIAGNRKGRKYLGEPIPLLYHEPFDPNKPWTFLRRHPQQLRANDRGKIANSQIRRYRRETFEEIYKKAKRRYSISSTFSEIDTSPTQAMFGEMYKPQKTYRKLDLKTKDAIIDMHDSHHIRKSQFLRGKHKAKKSYTYTPKQ